MGWGLDNFHPSSQAQEAINKVVKNDRPLTTINKTSDFVQIDIYSYTVDKVGGSYEVESLMPASSTRGLIPKIEVTI